MAKFSNDPPKTTFLGKTPVPFHSPQRIPWQGEVGPTEFETEYKYGIKKYGMGTYGIGQGREVRTEAADPNWQRKSSTSFQETAGVSWHGPTEVTIHVDKDAVTWQDKAEIKTDEIYAWGLGRWGCGDWGRGEPDIVTAIISPWFTKEPEPMATEVQTVTFLERVG